MITASKSKNLGYKRVNILRIGQIDMVQVCACVLQLPHRIQPSGAGVDLVSGLDQAQNRFPPDARRGSRHDGDFLIECIHFNVSLNSTITDRHLSPAPDGTSDAWNRSRELAEGIANERASCPPTSGRRGRRNWDLRSRAGRRLRWSQLKAGGNIGARAPAAPPTATAGSSCLPR